MVESIYKVIESYRNEGRINSDAALYAMSVSDEEDPRTIPLNLNTRYLLDACMFANAEIRHLMANKNLTQEMLSGVVHKCIDKAIEYITGSGMEIQVKENDSLVVRDYIVRCVEINFNSRKHGPTFQGRVLEIGRRNGYPDEVTVEVYTWAPYSHPVQFIQDPTDAEILSWFREEVAADA